MEKIKQSLEIYGLDAKEIKIYLCLLSMQGGSSYKIAKELNMPQSTVHDKLQTLKNKGIITAANINNTKYYSPNNLKSFKENLVTKLEAIQGVIPELEAISKQQLSEKPNVRFYNDKKGAKLVWEEILESYKKGYPDNIYGTAHRGLFELLPRFIPRWIKRRRETGAGINLMIPKSQRNELNWVPEKDNEEARFIADEYLTNSEITTFGNKTAIFSFDKKNPQTIVIESEKITDMFNHLLKFMWDHSKK